MTIERARLHTFELIVATAAVAAGCVDTPDMRSVVSPGMLNGMLNGFFHPEGLSAFLSTECPLLKQRLLHGGDLTQPFPAAFSLEIGKPECEQFMFYTAELMVPYGETLTLFVGGHPAGAFRGAMGLQHLVASVYPGYTFARRGFAPDYPVARKVVTQGYAALTNGITRTVSFKTNVPELDAHRAPIEDSWPRELLQLVPFTRRGLEAMANDPAFLARQPDFFEACDPRQTNYDYLKAPAAGFGALGRPDGYCPVPVVVRGDLDFVDDVIPGRSCRILEPGAQVAPTASTVGDVIVPPGGCPLIYYAGRLPGRVIYDDRQHNLPDSAEGCDVVGPSRLTNCKFDVVAAGAPVPADYITHYAFNVEPVTQP